MELKRDAVDQTAWDAFVSTASNGHFMQSWAWGDLQQASGWQVHRLALMDNGRIRAAAMLLARALPATGHRVFWAPRGPIFDSADTVAIASLLTGLRAYLGANRGLFLRVDPYEVEGSIGESALSAGGLKRVPRDWSYWNAPKFVFWLELRQDEEAIFKRMASNCQRDVRAGYRKNVTFSRGSVEDLNDFYSLMVSTGQTKGIAVHDLDYYRRLYETLGSSCDVGLFMARLEGKAIATGMSIRYGRTAWLLYAASDREHSKLGVNRNVQWEMIKWAHATGCSRYDFRGTATGDPPNPDDSGYGVYKFKKSFGPEFVRLAGYYDLVRNGLIYRTIRFGEERVLPHLYRAKVRFDERRSKL